MSESITNAEMKVIKVMLVEDSPVQRHILKNILNASPYINVICTAVNGLDALQQLEKLKPDVICTDYQMPVMDGLAFVERAIEIYPCPILVLSIAVQAYQTENIFKLLSAGAIDVMPKPQDTGGILGEKEASMLIQKIRILSGVKYLKKGHTAAEKSNLIALEKSNNGSRQTPKIIGIGSSTGGPQALENIFSILDKDFSIPIVCIQHISHGFLAGMVSWLQTTTKLSIEIALDGARPVSGHIYFAPSDQHLIVDEAGIFRLISPNANDTYCPKIDILFESISRFYGKESMGIVLSGMGDDGAKGLKSIFDAGGDTVAQDEGTSVIFGMPKVAIDTKGVKHVLPIQDIGPYLNGLSVEKSATIASCD